MGEKIEEAINLCTEEGRESKDGRVLFTANTMNKCARIFGKSYKNFTARNRERFRSICIDFYNCKKPSLLDDFLRQVL